MSVKKSVKALDTDELVDLLDKEDVVEDAPIAYENDILEFISTFNIQKGEERIKQHTLYTIYKAWSQFPIKKNQFLYHMNLFLESVPIKQSLGYLINQSAIKLTHAAYKYYTNENIRLSSQAWARHFENFLKFHSLTPGTRWIHGEILYFIYDKYCHATGLDNKPSCYLSKQNFSMYCKVYLKHKNTKKGMMYGISDNIESFFQIGQLARMEKEYVRKEKKAKVFSKQTRCPKKNAKKEKNS